VDGGNVGLCTVETGCALSRGRFGISQIADCKKAQSSYNYLKLFDMNMMRHLAHSSLSRFFRSARGAFKRHPIPL
jgi:hypothetical protein